MKTDPSKRKVLLIQSTMYDNRHKPVKNRKLNFIDLTTPYLAALFGDDWEVDICNEIIEEVPWDTDAELIGITSMGGALVRGMEIAEKFKKLGKTVIMGGFMASLIPEEAKNFCDAVMIGDAEGCWQEMMDDYLSGSLKPFYKKTITSLKNTPLPKYELVANKKIGYMLSVQAGRGCSKNCSFCSIACMYKGKYLRREISEVIRDIERVKELGFNKFLMIDDNIISDRAYTIALCKEIKKLKMSWVGQCTIDLAKDVELLKSLTESGCVGLSFGIESITKANLNDLHKAWSNPDEYGQLLQTLRNSGLFLSTSMMFGLENDTEESLRATADFIIKNKIAFPLLGILTPIVGTPYYEQVKDNEGMQVTDMYLFNPTKSVFSTKNLSVDDIDRLFWEINRKVFSLKSICKRLIFTTKFLKHPITSIFYIGVNLYYRYYINRGILCQW